MQCRNFNWWLQGSSRQGLHHRTCEGGEESRSHYSRTVYDLLTSVKPFSARCKYLKNIQVISPIYLRAHIYNVDEGRLHEILFTCEQNLNRPSHNDRTDSCRPSLLLSFSDQVLISLSMRHLISICEGALDFFLSYIVKCRLFVHFSGRKLVDALVLKWCPDLASTHLHHFSMSCAFRHV
ncbi:hypothetical protein KSP39_PZI019984 [Platanthera zijinensis]|uniref:Uncharacterized protein n=1 Tax=Platanthera zijinensis TaxID=2320716 RepID=A0AAP0AZ19_9ASPA